MTTSVPESIVGRVLDGRYRVLSHIADGGMASVYVALDQRLDREVALKVMRPGLASDETFVSRFRREARSAARLSHPHVVAVYDQGEDGSEVFLAMELVNGHTLRQVMKSEGPLTPRAALDILDPVLQALAAAHAAGLIHRDVKPENVILREDGMVKVADFGLARAVSAHTSTSQTGSLLGTVAYLSPEQVERGIADARSDVYAAGLLLFEMLTGTKAYTGETPIHVAYQHVHSQVPAPSSRMPSVPPELDELVARATSRDPDERPRDAGEFLAELRRGRAGLGQDELDRRPAAGGVVDDTSDSTAALSRTQVVPLGAPAGTVATAARRPQRRRALPLPWLLGGLAVLVAALLGWLFLAGPLASTTVPPVVGTTQQSAMAQLTRAHLQTRITRAFDEAVKPGYVMASNPRPGAGVRRGSVVTLTVSQGPERYSVPSLVGHSQAEATTTLRNDHLTVGSVRQAYDEKIPAGQVVSSSPPAGTRLKRNAPVDLVVSQGRQPITVQDFTGKPADQAVSALTGAGLRVDATQQQFSDTVAKGSVISQNPPGGTLYKGDKVTLVVSKGPQMVPVPDVVGKQQDQAQQILTAAGFQVSVQQVMGGFFGIVRQQSPAGGSKAPKGSTITLVVV
ncbi:Stk1 family PASTA domain-containing Ser/Thr kinase [Oryzihumus sp.]